MIPIEHWRPLEGLGYRAGAFGPEEYDCRGVMAEVLRRWLGDVEGLDVARAPEEDAGPWRPITAREALRTPGAVALTRSPDGALHVWIVLGNGRVLSSLPERGVRTVSMRVLSRGQDEMVGCYVHRAVTRRFSAHQPAEVECP